MDLALHTFGNFIVSSAYRVAICQHKKARSCSSSNGLKKGWEVRWSNNVPPKVQHFVWRLCHNSLAARMNLHKRLRTPIFSNPFFYLWNEDANHLFLFCNFAKEVWRQLGFSSSKMLSKATSLLHLFLFISEQCSEDPICLEKIFTILWTIWMARNDLIFSNKSNVTKLLVAHSLHYLHSYLSCQFPADDFLPTSTSRDIKWKPSNIGWMKVNVNVAFTNTAIGYGFIVRDHKVLVLASGLVL